jgi:hypothetical protein
MKTLAIRVANDELVIAREVMRDLSGASTAAPSKTCVWW